MKQMKCCLIAVLLVFGYANGGQAIWDIETVDSAGDVGWYCSLDLDSADNPSIAYYDHTNRDVKYARWNGAGWILETVDGQTSNCGQFTSLKLDTAGNPRIAYRNSSGYIACAIWTGAAFDLQTNGDTIDVGFGTSIDVGTDNSIHISYVNTGYNTHHYSHYNGAWTWTSIPLSGGLMETSLDLDSSNNPWIAGYSASADNLYMRYWNGASWVAGNPATTPENDGYWPSLKHDASGIKHVSYCRYTVAFDPTPEPTPTPSAPSLYNGDLRYRTYNGTSWSTVEIVEAQPNTYSCVGWFSSLDLDSSNRAHISYHDHANWLLKYATNASGSWVTAALDTATYQYGQTSLVLDGTQNPHIAYYDIGNMDLKYARWVPGSYAISGTIADGGSTPFENVYVYLSGNGITAYVITAANGTYAFSSIPAGDYTVSPSLVGYSFTPTQRVYPGLNQDYTAQDYTIATATGGSYIRGYVVNSQGYAIADVRLSLSGAASGTYITISDGYYEFNNLPAGDYTVTPFCDGWSFSPSDNTYTNLTVNQDDQRFTGTALAGPTPTPIPGDYAISGYVRNLANQPIANAAVTLEGAQQGTYTTGDTGYYAFGNLISGDFIIRVAKPDLVFEPANRTYASLSADQSEQDFIGSHFASLPGANDVKIVPSIFKPGDMANAHTSIQFSTASAGRVVIVMYSLDGVMIKTVLDEELPAGNHRATWSGMNKNNEQVASGIYLVDVKTPDYRKMKKICVIR